MTNDLIPYKPKPNPPVCTMRDENIVVKIWENKTGSGLYLNATIERAFEDKRTGDVRLARSFGLRDIRVLLKLLTRVRAEMEKRAVNNLK